MTKLLGVILLGACGPVATVSLPDAESDGAVVDEDAAPEPDASTARCEDGQPFGAPRLVQRLSSAFDDTGLTMTRSERIALLSRENGNATVLLAAARSSSSAAFELPVEEVMAPLNNAPGTEHHPSTTADGLLVYFERRSPQTVAIFAAPRADITSAFTAGASVTVDGESLAGVVFPVISSDGETLYFVDTADARLHAAERGANALSFGASSVRSTMAVAHPVLSDDGLTLFYAASGDILVSTRTATTEAFAPGVAVDGINSLERDVPLAITADGCVLMLASARDGGVGGTDIYEAVR